MKKNNNAKYSRDLDKLTLEMLNNNLGRLIKKALSMFVPRTFVDIVEWAEKNIVFPNNFPIPGPCRLINSPHLIEILRMTTKAGVHKISIKGCAQFGKTILFIIRALYKVCNFPGPILMGHPAEREVESFTEQKLDPIIGASPKIKKRFHSEKRGAGEKSRKFFKRFIGGFMEIISLSAKGTTRQRSVEDVYNDDIDAVVINKQTEGNPVSNCERRTTVYKYTYFIMNISTPSRLGESLIDNEFDDGSQAEYYVRCKECEKEFIMTDDLLDCETVTDALGNITEHLYKTTKVACRHCGILFNEKERKELLRAGFWVHKYPDREHLSYHLEQCSSTLEKMSRIMEDKVKAQLDPSKMETYMNLVKGLSYDKSIGDKPDWTKLLDRTLKDRFSIKQDGSNYIVPDSVLMITAAVDGQQGSGERPGRLEAKVVGWSEDDQCRVLVRVELEGDPKVDPDVFRKLDQFWETRYFREDGVELKLVRRFIDCGYAYTQIIQYCAGRQGEGIWPIKGNSQHHAPLLPRKITIANDGHTPILMLGVNEAKITIYQRLKINSPAYGYIWFNMDFCDADYHKQLVLEAAVIAGTGTVTYTVIKRLPKDRGRPNEALDLMVYNFCARKHALPDDNYGRLKKKIESLRKSKENQNLKTSEKSTAKRIVNKKSGRKNGRSRKRSAA